MSTPLDVETSPIWLWDSSNDPVRDVQSGVDHVDVLVVGAGLAGIAAAHALIVRRPDLAVMVVEAHHVGLGATGRSTGIIGPGLSTPLRALRRRCGDATARAAFVSTVEGAAEVGRLIAAEGIACDARLEQHVVAALTPVQELKMRRHTAQLAQLGLPVRWWSADEVASRLGPDHRSAFAYDDVLLVDPYRLVTGLAKAAERRGVRIHERTRVQALDRSGTAVVARTSAGVISAGRVLLATDGYGGALHPHRESVVPVRTHVLATAPLTEQQRRDLGWDGVGGVIDQRNFFGYFRLGAGGRLLYGGGPARVPTADASAEARASTRTSARLEREMRARFPGLAEVPVQARWSGLTGATTDRLPVVGPVDGDPRLVSIGGWCGHGLAMSVSVAGRVAELLADGAGASRSPLPWHRSSAPALRPAAARSRGVPAYLTALDWVDRLDSSAQDTRARLAAARRAA